MSLATHFDLVILDWAGTMVDFGCRAPVKALVEAFKRRGVSLSESQARRDMGKAKADYVAALLNDSDVIRAWSDANGAKPTARDHDALIADLGPLMREQAAQSATFAGCPCIIARRGARSTDSRVGPGAPCRRSGSGDRQCCQTGARTGRVCGSPSGSIAGSRMGRLLKMDIR